MENWIIDIDNLLLDLFLHILQKIQIFQLCCWRRLLRVPWTARRSNQSILKETSPGCSLEWGWGWNSNTLATSCEELTYWKRLWCWEGLGAGGEGDDRGWDGWMASPTWCTWVWVNSRSWWWTGRPGILRFMGFQRVRYDWVTELNWLNERNQRQHIQMERYSTFLGRKNQYFENDYTTKCNLQIQFDPY